MERLTKYSVLLIILLLPMAGNAGGGWTKKKGTGYYKLGAWWVVSDKHYTSNGGTDSNITTGTLNFSLYGEYGITDRLTGIMYLPFLSRTYKNDEISATNGMLLFEGEAINTIGDTDIGVKYGLNKPGSSFVLAGSLILGLPFGNNSGGRDGSLQTGDGEFNQMVRFDLSRSFSIGNVSGYGNIYTGFNNRTKNFSDEFRFGGELGISLFNSKAWFIARLDILESLKNGFTAAEASQGATLFANNTEFASYGYEAAVYLTDKLGVSAAYASAFSGEIIFASPSYSVGVFLDLK